jgi:succinyl-diaminopimelate desuccinylase
VPSTRLDRIDEREVVALTRRLVRFNTANPPGQEEAAARCLGEYLAAAGIAVAYQQVEPGRANLVARLPGSGEAGHLILSGHIDVVPAAEPGWEHDPFDATEVDGRLVGRGTADMKGGLAAMAVAMTTLAHAGFRPRGDLILTATVGEERGMAGVRHLVATDALAGSAYLVIGEPTGLDVCPAQKGALGWRITAHGRAAHSSMPERGVSAISYMARAIQALEEHVFPFTPSALLGGPTLTVATIAGGTVPNVIPEECSIVVSIRLVPGQSRETLEPMVRRVLDEAARASGLDVRVDVEFLYGTGRAVETAPEHPLVRAAVAAATEARGEAPAVKGFTGGTEAAFFCPALGVPMVIFGPGRLEQAHQPNEYVEISALAQATRAYSLIVQDLLG